MESKFEIKPPEQKPAVEGDPRPPRRDESRLGQGQEEKEPFDRAQGKPETPPEIDPALADKGGVETWEGEGGAVEQEKPKKKIKEKETLEHLSIRKKARMEALHLVIKHLDEGEPVKEFEDETRRVVYFDEEGQQYFLEERGQRKNIGIGDIVSDYAWGIKYVPDGEMREPAYRTLAKRVLANEARRDIENLYDQELAKIWPSSHHGRLLHVSPTQPHLEKHWKRGKELVIWSGFIAEKAVRELLNRIGLNEKLNFVVSRASALEDSIYRYDFKIRVLQRNRGVRVKSENTSGTTKFGIQFGAVKPRYARKKTKVIKEIKEKFVKELPVEDILIVTVDTDEFISVFNRWLELSKPSGGPEQFLSPELKKAILKAVTEKLVDIPQEVFDKIV